MNEPILRARVEPGEGGALRVLAPHVGVWSFHPHPGALVGPGSQVGIFERLGRKHALVLPERAAGRVAGPLSPDRSVAVEYAALLFELAPLAASDRPELLEEARAVGTVSGLALPPGHFAVAAPTDGIFYRSPAPGAAPFVKVGDRVTTGQPLGLVEVMKTFNQIGYGGAGFPEEAEVVEVRVADRDEVRAGQVLVLVRA